MAWPSPRFWKLCALDLAAAAALAGIVVAHLPAQHACSEASSAAGPGFLSLSAPNPAPACLRFHLR